MGQSTTLRMLLGLDRPTSGAATVGGHRLAELPHPMHVVGAVLDARSPPAPRGGRSSGGHRPSRRRAPEAGDRVPWPRRLGRCGGPSGRRLLSGNVGCRILVARFGRAGSVPVRRRRRRQSHGRVVQGAAGQRDRGR
ncbi:hypothetical protein [Micromonospora inyonensis]|uniref:hypothetical protein n=1 Tax=Micromonospora inyonensis TaxID=47866 RepID=UPI002480A7B4|nr:hypothetical protein [Micromonospora inyonensis]